MSSCKANKLLATKGCEDSCAGLGPVAVPIFYKQPINIPQKTLMSAGPSNCSDRVLKVMSQPILGHLHPETLKMMDDVKDGIRYLFQTRNSLTFCVSASGHGAMEAAMCNILEDGDVILIGVTGLWGHRAAEMARRYGADARFLEAGEGNIISTTDLRGYMEAHRPVAFFCVQGDSSTGICQPLNEFGEICREFDCIFIVDTVASLGSVELKMDEWKIDVLYTGSQKVLGGPPGITPMSFSAKAVQRMNDRNHKIKVYYFDALLLGEYWNCFPKPRIYHHTICSTILAGLREAIAQVCEEGLESVIARHQECSKQLQAGLKDLGLEMYVSNPDYRLPTVNSVLVPKNVEWQRIINYAMQKYTLEIGGGLGPTAGKIWRIGLMGQNANPEKVQLMLKVLAEALALTPKLDSKM